MGRKSGVQREDVYRAALMIKARGESVSIERVRREIGRGSPNTVVPFLREWRKEQGVQACAEMEVVETTSTEPAADDTPPELEIMARAIWERAKKHASERARRELHEQSFVLSQSQTALAARSAQLQDEERRIELAGKHLEESSSAAKQEIERWRDSYEAAKKECDVLNGNLSGAEAELERLRTLINGHVDELARRDQAIREAKEEHAAQVERVVAAFVQADEQRQRASTKSSDLRTSKHSSRS
ncbi:DNA-binding protein [Variovorax sp. dw_308]|uniref:DNA-binding protein n=1 Tax=Variovorax sp. dw_308 TaxID=2721546 RepID=UPI00210A2B59|nr:DNA-binding protein [Variovorax sp. dw_308]